MRFLKVIGALALLALSLVMGLWAVQAMWLSSLGGSNKPSGDYSMEFYTRATLSLLALIAAVIVARMRRNPRSRLSSKRS